MGRPLPWSRAAVLPRQHPPGRLRLGLVRRGRGPLRPPEGENVPVSCPVRWPHISRCHPFCKFTEANKYIRYLMWNSTLVAKQTCFYNSSCPSNIWDRFKDCGFYFSKFHVIVFPGTFHRRSFFTLLFHDLWSLRTLKHDHPYVCLWYIWILK